MYPHYFTCKGETPVGFSDLYSQQVLNAGQKSSPLWCCTSTTPACSPFALAQSSSYPHPLSGSDWSFLPPLCAQSNDGALIATGRPHSLTGSRGQEAGRPMLSSTGVAGRSPSVTSKVSLTAHLWGRVLGTRDREPTQGRVFERTAEPPTHTLCMSIILARLHVWPGPECVS